VGARRSLTAVGLAAGLALLLGGCVKNAPQDTLKAHGAMAQLENSLFLPVFWIATVVFVLVGGMVTYCVFRFRARSEDEAPRQIHGHTKAEIAWTIAPAVLLASIAIPTVKFVFDLNKFPTNAITINVTGHRWWWQMEYTKGTDPTAHDFNTASEMHIPVHQRVIVTLTSDDVIHNFWVPELAGKLYAIPGRHNKMVIEANTPGTYYGQCAEYCGTSHANMRLRVIAQTADDYAAWVAAQEAPPAQPVVASSSTSGGANSTGGGVTSSSSGASGAATSAGGTPAAGGASGGSPSSSTGGSSSSGASSGSTSGPSSNAASGTAELAATGAQVFKNAGCAGCHSITGISDGVVGPDLTHFKSRSVFAGAIFENNDNNLRLWLANPPQEKPGSVMPNLHLSEDQINQLVAYLDTLQ
jgi:cytochrome c oxidase subunit 2